MKRVAILILASACVLLGVHGCSDSDNNPPAPTATRTAASATATPTPSPTATPTTFPLHVEVLAGSNQEGGGMLVDHKEFQGSIPVYFVHCFNGQGDDCTGGTVLYTAGSPGVEALEESDPEESLFVLEDDTPLSLEVVAIDEGLSFVFEGETLSKPGDTADLGTTPELHADLETQLTLPGGDLHEVSVTFRLKTTRQPPYSDSEPFMITFVPVPSTSPGGGE